MMSTSATAKRFIDLATSRCATIVLLLAIAIASSCAHWYALAGNYGHPDEEIARAVVGKVLATKSKDTNWARTDVVGFRYDQFNFSSYYLVAAKIEKLLGHRAEDINNSSVLIKNLRQQNVIFGGIVVLLAGLLAWRLSNRFGAVIGATLTACNVTLFQDDLYARPETFVSVLTLAFVLVQISSSLRIWMILALSGFILGLLVAAKITFLLFLPFPLLAIAARLHSRHYAYALPHPWAIASACALYFVGIVFGFGYGAPYALHAPWEYLNGLGFLFKQYNGTGWWPYTLGDAGLLARLANGVAYLAYTQGWPALILFVVGAFSLLRERNHVVLFAVAGPLLTLLYFMQTRTFFERNFSHALPIMFAMSALGFVFLGRCIRAALNARSDGAGGWLAAAAGVVLVLVALPAYSVSATLYKTLFDGDRDKRVEAMTKDIGSRHSLPVLFAWADTAKISSLRGSFCGAVIHKIFDFGDLPSKRTLLELQAKGYRVEERFPSPFDGSPGSTLQSIHGPGFLFVSSPPDTPEKSCTANLELLQKTDYHAISTSAQMSPAWTLNGYPSELSSSDWPYPLYASWSGSDGKTGQLVIGPFEACGDVVVPYVVGPVRSGTLSIERDIGGVREVVTEGLPPPVVDWTAIRIHAAPACARYTIRAEDDGSGWGQWIGVGMPVELHQPNRDLLKK